MRTMPLTIAIAALVVAATPESTQSWSKADVRTMISRVQAATRAPNIEAQDKELADVGGMAYAVPRNQGESNENYAKRALRKREPDHPNVKKGQWLSALMRMFYLDMSDRCAVLARFETNRDDRIFFEKMAGESKQAANQIAGTLQLTIEGLEGFGEPLPVVPKGSDPKMRGATATVHQQKINIENIDRVTFSGHQPPESAARTGRGSLREVFAAMKQYNVSASMLGQYETSWRKNKGHFRAVIPASYPAVYLNEIVRGGLEAEMHTLHLMVMTKRGELRELELPLKWGLKPKGKKDVVANCADELSMQECVARLVHAQTNGNAVYGLE
jgi:hypothetical protein